MSIISPARISDAWEALPKELIEESFKICGISVALDGSEDRSIKCLRADGQIPFGYLRLSESRVDSLVEDLRIDTEADPEEDNGWDTDDSEEIVVLSANVSEDEATLDEDDSDES